MPLPNDFTQHDGLNWGHYTWIRRSQGVEDFLGSVRTSIVIKSIFESTSLPEQQTSTQCLRNARAYLAENNLSTWPDGYNARSRATRTYTRVLVSNLRSSLVNEFRFGFRRGRTEDLMAYDVPGKTVRTHESYWTSQRYSIHSSSEFLIQGFSINDVSGVFGSIGNTTPLQTYADTASWVRGKHAFTSVRKYGLVPVTPTPQQMSCRASCSDQACKLRVLTRRTCPPGRGDITTARAILSDLAGSVLQINEAFTLTADPKNISFQDFRQQSRRYRDIHQNEWSAFFKDD
jgi:hypothetical protein